MHINYGSVQQIMLNYVQFLIITVVGALQKKLW